MRLLLWWVAGFAVAHGLFAAGASVGVSAIGGSALMAALVWTVLAVRARARRQAGRPLVTSQAPIGRLYFIGVPLLGAIAIVRLVLGFPAESYVPQSHWTVIRTMVLVGMVANGVLAIGARMRLHERGLVSRSGFLAWSEIGSAVWQPLAEGADKHTVHALAITPRQPKTGQGAELFHVPCEAFDRVVLLFDEHGIAIEPSGGVPVAGTA